MIVPTFGLGIVTGGRVDGGRVDVVPVPGTVDAEAVVADVTVVAGSVDVDVEVELAGAPDGCVVVGDSLIGVWEASTVIAWDVDERSFARTCNVWLPGRAFQRTVP